MSGKLYRPLLPERGLPSPRTAGIFFSNLVDWVVFRGFGWDMTGGLPYLVASGSLTLLVRGRLALALLGPE
jgi:hypothetical protein